MNEYAIVRTTVRAILQTLSTMLGSVGIAALYGVTIRGHTEAAMFAASLLLAATSFLLLRFWVEK